MRGNEQALRFGQLCDRLVEAVPELEVAKCRIRSAGLVAASTRVVLVERHVGRAAGPRPCTDVLDDAEDPGREPCLAAKVREAAVDLEKHFLRQIIDARSIRDHPVDQAVDEVLVLIDELAERCVVA